MTTPPSFPALAGLGWSVHKRPVFSTLVAPHVSGREVRDPLYQYPIWEFEIAFDGLASSAGAYPGLGANSLQTLLGFFLQCGGQATTFLYSDPTDNAVTAQGLAAGDGATLAFPFARALGGFLEPVGWVTNVANVYLNGVNQASGWSLTAPNTLTFATTPASGALVSASFSYAFQCRFDADSLDLENFMKDLWKVDSVKFRSVRSS